MRREALEEVGLRIELVGEPAVVVEPETRRVDVIFAARPVAGADPDAVAPRSPEIAECRWFAADDLPPLQHETAGALVVLAPAELGRHGPAPTARARRAGSPTHGGCRATAVSRRRCGLASAVAPEPGDARVAQLAERPGLDLADPLAGEIERVADLGQRAGPVGVEPEAQRQDGSLALVEPGELGPERLALERGGGDLVGRLGVGVLDEVAELGVGVVGRA